MARVTGAGGASGPPVTSEDEVYKRIHRSPKFQDLVRRRSTFAWTLAIIMLVIYYGFILLVAFAKGFLAIRIGAGVITLGILIALAVIIAAFVLTAIYVYRANGEFDALSDELQKEVMQ